MSKFVHSELSDIIKTHENMDVMGNKGDEQSDTGRGGVSDAMLRQSAAVHLLDSYRMFISTVILVSDNMKLFYLYIQRSDSAS